MSEVGHHITERPKRPWRPIVSEVPDDEKTQEMKAYEGPRDTIIQTRDEVEGVMEPCKNPADIQQLQDAFEGMDKSELPDGYTVEGEKCAAESDSVFKLTITGTADRNAGSSTTVNIGFAPNVVFGDDQSKLSPYWEIQGAKLDLEFQDKLVKLMENTIAKVRST